MKNAIQADTQSACNWEPVCKQDLLEAAQIGNSELCSAGLPSKTHIAMYGLPYWRVEYGKAVHRGPPNAGIVET